MPNKRKTIKKTKKNILSSMSIKSTISTNLSCAIHYCCFKCEIVPYTMPCIISDNLFTPKLKWSIT